MVRVVLLGRRGCHLCETAEAVLRAEQIRTPFELNVIDIDTDPELQALYGPALPHLPQFALPGNDPDALAS